MKVIFIRILTAILLGLLTVVCVTACGADDPETETSATAETTETTGTTGTTGTETESQTEETVHTHTEETIPGKTATCTETGLTEGKKCAVCGEILVAQEVIPAKGHTYENGFCTNCGAKEPLPSEGLEFIPDGDGESYSVAGIGTCTDTDIVIPSTYDGKPVTGIGRWAFMDCNGLTSIVIPDSVTSIGWRAFYHCESLTRIVIPDSVTSIDRGLFTGCYSLESITVAEGNPVYHSDGNCLIETSSKTLIVGCKNSVIPADGSVTGIGESAFSGCTYLTNIVIPDCVTDIGPYAFYHCEGLESIVIPDSVTQIGGLVFTGCESLESVVIPDSVTSIPTDMFFDCTSLTSVTFGSGVTSIGWGAFGNCISLTEIVIPEGVTEIEGCAFFDCTGLERVVIPESVMYIGRNAFDRCDRLIQTESGVRYVDKWAVGFDEKDVSSITLRENTVGISEEAFADFDTLEWLVIPESVRYIINGAFSGCYNLERITVDVENPVYHSMGDCLIETSGKVLVLGCKNSSIPSDGSVTGIGKYAFSGCTYLTDIVIPDCVTSIGEYAFSHCIYLTEVVIPEGVTRLGDWAFCCCESLESIVFKGTVAQWEKIYNYIWDVPYKYYTVHCTDGELIEKGMLGK